MIRCDRYNPHFLQGVDCFNRQAYFNAHECWERWWIEEGYPADGCAKGLVQVAVAMHHLAHGNLRGCEKLLASSRRLLGAAPADLLGFDLAGLLDQVERRYSAARDGREEQTPIPHIDLTSREIAN